LTQLQLINTATSHEFILDDYRFVITNLPSESSRVYKRALRHMDFDDPQLRNTLTDLRRSFTTHNDLLNEAATMICDIIENRLTSTHLTPIVIGGRIYNYNLPAVQKYLSEIWRPSGGNERISYDLIERNISNSTRKREISYFLFNNIPVGQGMQAEFDNMSIALDDISRNHKIVGLLYSIENSEDKLRDEITRIKEMAASIVGLIDREDYDTKVLRCCTYYLGFI
jgi:hypothetical protein